MSHVKQILEEPVDETPVKRLDKIKAKKLKWAMEQSLVNDEELKR